MTNSLMEPTRRQKKSDACYTFLKGLVSIALHMVCQRQLQSQGSVPLYCTITPCYCYCANYCIAIAGTGKAPECVLCSGMARHPCQCLCAQFSGLFSMCNYTVVRYGIAGVERSWRDSC